MWTEALRETHLFGRLMPNYYLAGGQAGLVSFIETRSGLVFGDVSGDRHEEIPCLSYTNAILYLAK